MIKVELFGRPSNILKTREGHKPGEYSTYKDKEGFGRFVTDQMNTFYSIYGEVIEVISITSIETSPEFLLTYNVKKENLEEFNRLKTLYSTV